MPPALISICIPTYNRDRFLRECLESLTRQFSNQEVAEKVNIFILDNRSQDTTEAVAGEFTARFSNVKYIKDSQNRDIIRGIIQAATLADGKYLWIFSDDDLHTSDSLNTAIKFIEKTQAELIFCNLAGFVDKDVILYPNLLKISEDVVVNKRSELFELLNTKFYSSIDYYTTLCSNWIIKKEIFDNQRHILDIFNKKLDLFPLPSLIFYSDFEFRAGAIAKQIILNRGDNESWGRKNKIKHFFYRDSIWRDYYKKIATYNRAYLPRGFRLKIHIKNILRFKDLAKIIIGQILKYLGLYKQLKKLIKKIP